MQRADIDLGNLYDEAARIYGTPDESAVDELKGRLWGESHVVAPTGRRTEPARTPAVRPEPRRRRRPVGPALKATAVVMTVVAGVMGVALVTGPTQTSVAGNEAGQAQWEPKQPRPGAGTASAATDSDRRMLFVGDSISSWFNDDLDDEKRGWWSFMAAELGFKAETSAVGASGFLRAGGKKCASTTFGERLHEITESRPDVLVIAGGRNDFRYCPEPDAAPVPATRAQLQSAVTEYLSDLVKTTDAIGMKRHDIYLLTPWGDRYGEESDWVVPIVRAAVKSAGLTWIETGHLPAEMTTDGTHPTPQGQHELVKRIYAGSNLDERFTR